MATQAQCEALGLACKAHLEGPLRDAGVDVTKIDWSKFLNMFISLLPLILALFPAPTPTPGPAPVPPTPAG